MKKNIIKSVIALSFIVGAIVSFNVEANARIDIPKEGCTSKNPCDEIATSQYDKCNDTFECCALDNPWSRGCKRN